VQKFAQIFFLMMALWAWPKKFVYLKFVCSYIAVKNQVPISSLCWHQLPKVVDMSSSLDLIFELYRKLGFRVIAQHEWSSMIFFFLCSHMVSNSSSLFMSMSNLIWIDINIMEMKMHMLASKEKERNNYKNKKKNKNKNKIIYIYIYIYIMM